MEKMPNPSDHHKFDRWNDQHNVSQKIGNGPNPVAKSGASPVTLTAAELFSGIITSAINAGSSQNYTTPTAQQIADEWGKRVNAGPDIGDYFDFSVINIGNNAADVVTMVGGSNVTLVGKASIASATAASGASSAATFRVRKTANTPTFSVYRIAG